VGVARGALILGLCVALHGMDVNPCGALRSPFRSFLLHNEDLAGDFFFFYFFFVVFSARFRPGRTESRQAAPLSSSGGRVGGGGVGGGGGVAVGALWHDAARVRKPAGAGRGSAVGRGCSVYPSLWQGRGRMSVAAGWGAVVGWIGLAGPAAFEPLWGAVALDDWVAVSGAYFLPANRCYRRPIQLRRSPPKKGSFLLPPLLPPPLALLEARYPCSLWVGCLHCW